MRKLLLSACALAALVGAGCSPGAKTGTVSGQVTLDGQPLKEGRIQFIPVAGDSPTAGATIKDGKFSAEVPLAKMRVEINANKVIGKRKAYDTPESPVFDEVAELIPPKYNVNSQETLEVKSGSQEVKYELKSK